MGTVSGVWRRGITVRTFVCMVYTYYISIDAVNCSFEARETVVVGAFTRHKLGSTKQGTTRGRQTISPKFDDACVLCL